MPRVKLSITVEDQHLSHFAKKHKDLGVATGSIDADKIDSLRKVQGVDHVEEERQIQISPPESDIQ